MSEIADVLKDILPVGGYGHRGELKDDITRLMMAENPVEEPGQSVEDRYRALGEPEILSMDVEGASDDDLERAVEEWNEVREGLSTMYRRKAEYFEWEYRRAYVLELLSEAAADEFGDSESAVAGRHRITIEVNMWAAFAKHQLLKVKPGDVSTAENEYGFVELEVKHRINEAIMTSASIFESVGTEILVRCHGRSRNDHVSMAEVADCLHEHGYIEDGEYYTVDAFRREIRNDIAHDILQRTRFGDFDDFRREVIGPCWELIELSVRLAEVEIAPDG